jgi:hypothetical protein
METTMQTILDEVAHMEFRLTEALARSGRLFYILTLFTIFSINTPF